MFILMKLLSKKLMKQLSFFNTNFQNLFQDVVYYKILERQTLRHFQQKAEFEKNDLFSLGSK